jgi:flagellar basal-body rod protein FlgG
MIKFIFCIFFISILFSSSQLDSIVDTATQALSFHEAKHAVLMENAINIKTPGYRSASLTNYFDPTTGVREYKKNNSFSQGSIVGTSRKLDFAIEGSAFFVLIDNNGRMYFTRDGKFHINNNLELVSISGGLRVLDENNLPITLMLNNEIIVDENGYVYDTDNNVITRLRIVDIYNKKRLRTANNVLFFLQYEDHSQIYVPEDFAIKQGFYETSNVDYNKLMVEMADKNNYSSNTQIIQTRLKMMEALNGLMQN